MHGFLRSVYPGAVLIGSLVASRPLVPERSRRRIGQHQPNRARLPPPCLAGGAADNGIPTVYHLPEGMKVSPFTHPSGDPIHTTEPTFRGLEKRSFRWPRKVSSSTGEPPWWERRDAGR